MGSDSDGILTIDELSGYLKVSKSTLYKLAKERRADDVLDGLPQQRFAHLLR